MGVLGHVWGRWTDSKGVVEVSSAGGEMCRGNKGIDMMMMDETRRREARKGGELSNRMYAVYDDDELSHAMF